MKQQYHLRKIKNKLVPAGRGFKNPNIGKLVVYKGKVYTPVKVNTDGTFNLKNLTAKTEIQRVNKRLLRKY